MPRPPKKENEGNPLKKLRQALGKHGIPMPQHTLARRLDLSPETVKAIEAGRRRQGDLGDDLIQRIYVRLGAIWSAGDQKWSTAEPGVPLSLEYCDRRQAAEFDRDTETHAMCLRLLLLLYYTPNSDFKGVVDTVEAKMEEVMKQFHFRPDGKDRDWLNTRMHILPKPRGELKGYRPEDGDPNDIVYVRRRPVWPEGQKQLFDFTHRLECITPRNRTCLRARSPKNATQRPLSHPRGT
jgi:transcriptional regulator with XRE-family HTH domain